MSEEKIIKHTQTAVHLIANKEKTWRKKVLELIEEVAIIIFAVSITLAFHNWNDSRSERSNKVNAAYGRFESFKSSGYLSVIENQELLKDLTGLYTVYMPVQEKADEMIYDKRATDYNTYIGVKATVDSEKVVYVSLLLNDPAVRHQIVYYGILIHERIKYKKELAIRIGSVIAEIDAELSK
jgi:hypothetical protein